MNVCVHSFSVLTTIFRVDLGSPFWISLELRVMEVMENWSYKTCKAPVTTNKPTPSFITGRMPFLSPNQQCQSIEDKVCVYC